jgi:hypothetical protein
MTSYHTLSFTLPRSSLHRTKRISVHIPLGCKAVATAVATTSATAAAAAAATTTTTASQLDKVPHRPLLVSTTANQSERPLLTLAPKGPAADVARMT